MITIEQDFEEGTGTRFKIKFTAPGMGWRPLTYKRATLEEVHMAIEHHYNQHTDLFNRGTDSPCIVCRKHSTK